MTIRRKIWGIVCVLILAGGVSFGQSKQSTDASAQPAAQTEHNDGRHYQMVFVAREVEGSKVINSRRYETDTSLQGPAGGVGSIRTGSKVPIATGPYNNNLPAQTQFNYVDVGVNLDFNRAKLEGDRVFVWVTAEISSIDAAASDSAVHQPIIRQNKWNAGVTVPLGKPTVIFSSDDVSSKRTMQIELTVTPVK